MLSKVGNININGSYYCFSTTIFCGNHICSKLKMGLLWLEGGGATMNFMTFSLLPK